MVDGVHRIDIVCPSPRLGDYYSPFFSVRFFANTATFRAFEASLNARRRANRQAPVAFGIKEQPPSSAQDFENRQGTGVGRQKDFQDFKLENYVTQLEITHVGAGVSRMSMTLSPPYDVAVKILESRFLGRGSLALVELGYSSPSGNDILSGPFLFRILNPDSEFGDEISITLNGNDILSYALMGRAVKRTWKRSSSGSGQEPSSGGSYPTDLKIIETLAKCLQLKVNTDGLSEDSELSKVRSNAREQNVSDWVFLRNIIDESKVTDLICGGTLYLADRLRVLNRKTYYRLMYRSQLIKDTDIPISSINFPSPKELFNTRKGKDIEAVTYDRDRGVEANAKVSSRSQAYLGDFTYSGNTGDDQVTTTSRGSFKDCPAPMRANENQDAGEIQSGSKEDELLKSRVETLAEEAAIHSAIKGTVTIPGVPGLRPQDKVILYGLPKYYLGEYVVKTVTHRLGEGYTQELEILKHGTKLKQQGTTESVNKKEETGATKNVEVKKNVVTRDGRVK